MSSAIRGPNGPEPADRLGPDRYFLGPDQTVIAEAPPLAEFARHHVR